MIKEERNFFATDIVWRRRDNNRVPHRLPGRESILGVTVDIRGREEAHIRRVLREEYGATPVKFRWREISRENYEARQKSFDDPDVPSGEKFPLGRLWPPAT